MRWRSLPLLCAAIFLLESATSSALAQAPISGQPVPSLSQLDTIMQNVMTTYHSPGGSLAISVDGRLVFARGYGYARTDTGEFVQPDSLFRVASNSKPLTATGILKLIEQGKLSLSTKPFATILNDLTPPSGTTEDSRYANITIQNLLEHTAGFDDTSLPDPVFAYVDTAAYAYGLAAPATPKVLISYMLGQPLQHDPGTTYAYSNFGYVTLGYIIERISGIAYADFIKTYVLAPAGVVRTQHGGTLLSNRLTDEVAYYDYPNAPLVSSVVPPIGSSVPTPYGGFSMDLHAANGGWVSSTMDLLRVWDSLNGQSSTNILSNPPTAFTGYIPPLGYGWYYYFEGSLPGTNSLVRLDTTNDVVGRVTYAAIFNTRTAAGNQPQTDVDTALNAFIKTVKSWPSGDRFSTYNLAGSACNWNLGNGSATLSSAGGSGAVTVTDANYCAWSGISNNASWLHVTSGALNSDSGTVGYSVDVNTGAIPRTGTIAIANQVYTVTQAAPANITALGLVANRYTASYGQLVTLTATLSPSSAGMNSTNGQTVTFLSNSTTLGTAALSGGLATLQLSSLPVGTTSITVQYNGDSSFSASTSSAVSVTVISNNVWVANGNGTTSALSQSGSSVVSGASGGGIALAIDNSGNVWSLNTTSNTVSEVSKTGATVTGSPFPGGGLSAPVGLAIDGAGSLWIANSNNSVTVLNSTGTPVSSIALQGGNLNGPSSIAVDNSGNVWISNSTGNSLTEFIGGATPVTTPLVQGVSQNSPAAKP